MSCPRHLLGLALVLVLVTGCAPVLDPLPVAASTASATLLAPTVTPLPLTSTATVSPTVTYDPAQVQLELLYRSSLKYLAGNNAETIAVAQSLDVSPGMTGRSVCGPLSFAILRDAGLVSQSIDLHDYWFLYPPEDARLLEQTFPRQDFEWISVRQPIDEIDYHQFPLKAGDLLFLYSGPNGDYAHVLVVTRVDADGRAYSVTNNYTDDGFVILEYMLYDPAQSGEGMFYEWTDPDNARLGLTGFGGFDLWRPKILPYAADADSRE